MIKNIIDSIKAFFSVFVLFFKRQKEEKELIRQHQEQKPEEKPAESVELVYAPAEVTPESMQASAAEETPIKPARKTRAKKAQK